MPSPPSARGTLRTSSKPARPRPDAIAAAASGAVSVPRNLSGHATAVGMLTRLAWMLERVPLLEKDLAQYAEVVGDEAVAQIREAAAPLEGARVLHVSASAREADSVLAELLAHARQAGVAVASGRLEPHLVVPLRRRIAVVGFARQPVIHSHDPELLAVLASDDSLLTRLDAEWFAN